MRSTIPSARPCWRRRTPALGVRARVAWAWRQARGTDGDRVQGENRRALQNDLVVDDRVVLEVKSTQRLNREDPRQVLNYLRATNYEIGLLLHFGPEPAFHRFVSTNKDPRKGATQNQRVPLPRSSRNPRFKLNADERRSPDNADLLSAPF